MHFVITGGAGFIGSHVTEELLKKDHQVTVIDNLTSGSLQNLPHHPNLRLINKDISNCCPQDFEGPLNGLAHLAATPSVTESWLQPLESHHNNLSTTIAVIQLCQALGIPRLVLASSAAVYGNPSQAAISEDSPTVPISPYGLQKLVSEQYASLFARELGFSFVSLRMFNVFGPRQRPNSQYSGVISIFTETMYKGLPLTVYGNGSQTRDFIFVQDVAQGFVQALTVPLQSGSRTVCNLGTGHSISLLQLIDILQTFFPKWEGDIRFASPRLGDIQHSQAVISKAESVLGFIPQWSTYAGLKALTESLFLDKPFLPPVVPEGKPITCTDENTQKNQLTPLQSRWGRK